MGHLLSRSARTISFSFHTVCLATLTYFLFALETAAKPLRETGVAIVTPPFHSERDVMEVDHQFNPPPRKYIETVQPDKRRLTVDGDEVEAEVKGDLAQMSEYLFTGAVLPRVCSMLHLRLPFIFKLKLCACLLLYNKEWGTTSSRGIAPHSSTASTT